MSEHAISNAKAWLGDIVATIAALAEAEASDYCECGQCEGSGETQSASNGEDEECPVCDGTGEIDHEEDSDTIRERIQEEPLSIRIREGWKLPGEEGEPYEFELLLSTGGPALRIYGALDGANEPDDGCRLEWQDWGTPWTAFAISAEEQAALTAYARQFYYGN